MKHGEAGGSITACRCLLVIGPRSHHTEADEQRGAFLDSMR